MARKASTVLLASAIRTASPTVPVLSGSDGLVDIQIILNATLDGAAASVQPVLEGYDEASSTWYDLVASITPLAAVGTIVISYGENTPVVANTSNQGMIPSRVRLTLTHADADAITYSVGMNSSIR